MRATVNLLQSAITDAGHCRSPLVCMVSLSPGMLSRRLANLPSDCAVVRAATTSDRGRLVFQQPPENVVPPIFF
ncbi:hypothetical protein HN51_039911 [Arachis hypogaea]